MSSLKQAIVIRKDLNFNKRQVAQQVAKASLKFIIENNEAERGGKLVVSLSNDEVAWLTGSFSQDILGVKNKDQLDDIMFRAQILGIEAYPVFTKGEDETETSCIALGPDESGVINKLIHGLKPF
ncbi:MAG: hypothetical protein EBU90_07255 [Proteobacteria bacterium]|nr:hypothetical protein [Pseudomonadota bacterium]